MIMKREKYIIELGLCYMFASEWEKARDAYVLSEQFFRRHRTATDVEARLVQVINMRKGCQAKIDEKLAADSIARAKVIEDSLRAIAASIPLDSIITEKPIVSQPVKPTVTTPRLMRRRKLQYHQLTTNLQNKRKNKMMLHLSILKICIKTK